ncbi:MAG: heavy metal translocating P-type ATPase, partial [Anaerotignum sp.]
VSFRAFTYVKKAVISYIERRKLTVEILDATAITSSLVQNKFSTAGSIMFLLSITEMVEHYCKGLARSNLERSLELDVEVAELVQDDAIIIININDLKIGDVIYASHLIPVDGTVVSGEAMVNQATMTGESLPVSKTISDSVFAGTFVEEGSIKIKVTAIKSDTRISRMIGLIEQNEDFKASIQSRSERIADAIVPYSFLASLVTYLCTRSFVKASSIFMVDYSCAIKLSTSLCILGAINESYKSKVAVKGGRFLEELAKADTIVFDKTGTLTKATPIVKDVIPFKNYTKEYVLKTAACLEEHFPHSVAHSVVRKAMEEGLNHKEEHAEVEYIIAHGIASRIEDKSLLIGSYHFVFEDENVTLLKDEEEIINRYIDQYSILYFCVDHELAGIILIDDPVRETSKGLIESLHQRGLNVVMLTGDSENIAKKIADELNIDHYQSRCLPEDKANYIQNLKEEGHTVIMVGDGINDTYALSVSDVSVSLKDSTEVAKNVSNIILLNTQIIELLDAIDISNNAMKRIKNNYNFTVAFNSSLILLSVFGLLTTDITSLLHNVSTIGIGVRSTRPFI